MFKGVLGKYMSIGYLDPQGEPAEAQGLSGHGPSRRGGTEPLVWGRKV